MMRNKLLFVGLLLLSACSSQPTTAPLAEVPEPQASEPVVVPPQENVVLEAEVPEIIVVDFDMINNQTPASIQNYLGQPSLVRRDENVQIMIYETEACVFQVTFYEPASGDHFRAEHTDARTRKGSPADVESCVQQLLNAQQ